MTIKNLKAKVKAVMTICPETRNSDIALTLELWRRYFPQRIIIGKDGKSEYVRLSDIFDLPREDNVKRVRAHIQNDLGELLPTTWEIAHARRINEDRWRAAMGGMAHASV